MPYEEIDTCPECAGSGDHEVWDERQEDWVPEDCRQCRGTGVKSHVPKKKWTGALSEKSTRSRSGGSGGGKKRRRRMSD